MRSACSPTMRRNWRSSERSGSRAPLEQQITDENAIEKVARAYLSLGVFP